MIVEGQLVGGAAHAIGNALYEWMGYDDAAQPLTTTFADYLLPSATEVPKIEVTFAEFPSPLNPLGVKGVGESRCVPAAGAIVSAIENALAPFDVRISEYPVTPARLFALLAGRQKKQRERGGGQNERLLRRAPFIGLRWRRQLRCRIERTANIARKV